MIVKQLTFIISRVHGGTIIVVHAALSIYSPRFQHMPMFPIDVRVERGKLAKSRRTGVNSTDNVEVGVVGMYMTKVSQPQSVSRQVKWA